MATQRFAVEKNDNIVYAENSRTGQAGAWLSVLLEA
jgi:hypothetical protein